MKNAVLGAVAWAVVAVSVALVMVLARVGKLVDDTDATVLQIQASTVQISQKLQTQLDGLGQVEGQAKNVLASINAQEQAQSRKIDQTTKDLSGAARDFRELVFYTHKNLNEPGAGVLPQLDQLATRLNASAPASFDSFTRAADTLNIRLADPQIPELLGRIDSTALHLNGIAANSEAMSGDMKLAVHRLSAPPSKWHQALDVGWTTAKFGSLFIP